MKILFLLLILSSTCTAQKYVSIPKASPIPIDSTTRTALFQEVVSVDTSASLEELANREKSWAGKAYMSTNSTIEQYDVFTGTLVLKGVFNIEYLEHELAFGIKTKKQLAVYHTVTVEAKKGRCRITIDGFSIKKPDYRNQYGQLVSPKPMPYIPKVYIDAVELYNEKRTLMNQFNSGEGWAERNAPIYLASERNIDAAIYAQTTLVLTSFKQTICKREKDW